MITRQPKARAAIIGCLQHSQQLQQGNAHLCERETDARHQPGQRQMQSWGSRGAGGFAAEPLAQAGQADWLQPERKERGGEHCTSQVANAGVEGLTGVDSVTEGSFFRAFSESPGTVLRPNIAPADTSAALLRLTSAKSACVGSTRHAHMGRRAHVAKDSHCMQCTNDGCNAVRRRDSLTCMDIRNRHAATPVHDLHWSAVTPPEARPEAACTRA
ncbi:hypothetical protein MMC29_003827 [Sticta canariensis]|nr:hypothetical protein [Sticta canariensis]